MDFAISLPITFLILAGASVILTALSIILYFVSFLFSEGKKRKARLFALFLLVSGPVIDYVKYEAFQRNLVSGTEIYDQRKKLPITKEMDQKITQYATVRRVDVKASYEVHFTPPDSYIPSYRPSAVTVYLDVKKSGNYTVWAGSQGYTYTLKEGPNTLNVNLTSFLDSDLKVGIKIEYYSTYKEVYGENYPGINGHRTLDINLPHTFPVFEGYIKANLIPE